ncbi:DNA translocase FtsK, partial [Methanocalculus natronophilus]|uniref:DNA translocase FtsK n=1 Tax=Methanocalculus natronophilus TaxID=1262400 RepID=UPI0031B58B18
KETPSETLSPKKESFKQEDPKKESFDTRSEETKDSYETQDKQDHISFEAPANQSIKQTVKAGQNLYTNYQVPPVSLLKDPEEKKPDLTEFIEAKTNRSNETFSEFNIGARVFNHTEGPTVTRFEIALEKGVKVNKITTLTDNIKMALEAKEIRIEAPIPGKKTVGIEVPNDEAQTVHFSNIVRRSMFKNAAMPLT